MVRVGRAQSIMAVFFGKRCRHAADGFLGPRLTADCFGTKPLLSRGQSVLRSGVSSAEPVSGMVVNEGFATRRC